MNHSLRFLEGRGQTEGLRRFVLATVTTVVLALLCGAPSLGQSTFGSIVGTVKDSSGDVMIGTTVTLINTGTSAKRQTTTDQSGTYSFINLDPGIYMLEVESTGFQKTAFENLDLQARETKRVDASLRVATATETVVVEAGAAVVTTDESNLS